MEKEKTFDKQTRLEQEGIKIRKETIIKNDFNNKTDVYNEEHDKTRSHNDELHPHGKGTGHPGHTHTIPNRYASKTAIDKTQFDTENGGGSYDIFGYGKVGGKNKAGGRNFSKSINLYSSERQYNENSVDTSKNVEDGQWVNRY